MVGWAFCRGAVAVGGGHLAHRSKACDSVRVPECVEAMPLQGPMEPYGRRSSPCSPRA